MKDDRDKAIWQYVRDKQTCRSCGTRKAEWLESAGGRRDAHRAALDICPGCECMQTFEASIDKDKRAKGSFVALIPNTRGR